MCEEESDDAEAVAKLLEINDSIHRTIERYKLMKGGNVQAANQIAKGTLGTTTGVGKNAANELSLIDFDPDPPAASGPNLADSNGSLLDTGAGTSTQAAPKTVEDDLLGLSLGDPSPAPLGSIFLGPGGPSGAQPSNSFSSNLSFPTNQAPVPHTTTSPKPNYDAFASLTSALPSSKPTTPAPAAQQARQPSQTHTDPFAALVASSSRPSTPGQSRLPQPALQASTTLKQTSSQPADEDWMFESALPASNVVKVLSSAVEIEFEPRRPQGQPAIQITARFSNTTSQPITGLHFYVAVEKSYSLELKPQTGRDMPPLARHAIQQEVILNGVPVGKGNAVKMRFKVSYELNGQTRDEQGNVPSLGIS